MKLAKKLLAVVMSALMFLMAFAPCTYAEEIDTLGADIDAANAVLKFNVWNLVFLHVKNKLANVKKT